MHGEGSVKRLTQVLTVVFFGWWLERMGRVGVLLFSSILLNILLEAYVALCLEKGVQVRGPSCLWYFSKVHPLLGEHDRPGWNAPDGS